MMGQPMVIKPVTRITTLEPDSSVGDRNCWSCWFYQLRSLGMSGFLELM